MSSDKNGDAKSGIKDSTAAPAKESSSKSGSSSESKSSSEQLNLRVIGQDGEVIQFKIKSNTPFRKLMSVYCDRLKLVQNNIRYVRADLDLIDCIKSLHFSPDSFQCYDHSQK